MYLFSLLYSMLYNFHVLGLGSSNHTDAPGTCLQGVQPIPYAQIEPLHRCLCLQWRSIIISSLLLFCSLYRPLKSQVLYSLRGRPEFSIWPSPMLCICDGLSNMVMYVSAYVRMMSHPPSML